MSKLNEGTTRRNVLKTLGAGTAASIGLTAGATAQPSSEAAKGPVLNGKKVYVGRGLELDLPAEAGRATQMETADVAALSSDVPEGRERGRTALGNGLPLLLVGERADDALLSILYDVEPEQVSAAVKESVEPSVDHKFGFEYQEDLEVTSAGAYPHGGVLSTHAFFTTSDGPTGNDAVANPGQGVGVSKRFATENVQKFVGLNTTSDTENSVSSDGFSTQAVDDSSQRSSEGSEMNTTSCAEAGSGWDCLGRAHYSGDLGKYGDVDHYVWCAATDPPNSDSDFNFFSLKSQMMLKPGIDQSSSKYRNNFLTRNVTLANDSLTRGDHLMKHGPNSTTGTKSSTFSATVNVGAKGELGAGFGWSWTETYSNVLITESVGEDDQHVDHHFDINRTSNPGTTTYEAFPGYRVNVMNDANNVAYDYKNRYGFAQAWYDGNSEYTHREYGTGNWYL